ncbi:MAG: CDP-glycerol glycerophosphotransferase family protein [Faecalibacterium sp.]|nr:CDP-glycerol glycerophosphotransferase family protein [Ruminococcus sp.]MCM1392336.1 CDP-glycerol glycerophosphotransferase family protein [Ruminococcus sp.]MCM1486039.1 CDP-glycerol glycerophosphotransferase family protein [Faecalibacterium sp.]
MKNLLYSFYALLFNVSTKLFSVKKNRVALVSMHNENFNDALGGVYRQLEKDGKYEFVFITRQDLEVKATNIFRVFSFFFVKSRKLATSKYVFLNDNFMPMAKLNFRSQTIVTQLWHAEGAFKKFGLAIEQPENIRKNEIELNKRLSYVVCSSKAVAPLYAEAFGVDESKVLPLGSARTDYFFQRGVDDKAKARINAEYPELKGKKLVLYAPTFRDKPEHNVNILSHFDISAFNKALGDEYALLVRLHPQLHENIDSISGAVDVTEFDDVRDLVLACDILITDYSSICMDFSLLDKKTIFFAYDLEEYIAMRDFYFSYEDYVPGAVVRDTNGIIDEIRMPLDHEKNERFKRFNFDFADADSANRIVEAVMK